MKYIEGKSVSSNKIYCFIRYMRFCIYLSWIIIANHIILLITVDITIITSENVNEPIKPPRIMMYGLPVKVMQNANAAPSPIINKAGPSNALFKPASGSFACKKNSTRVDMAPINAFMSIIKRTFWFWIKKCQLSQITFLKLCPIVDISTASFQWT